MQSAIGENWYARDCPACRRWMPQARGGGWCPHCPLAIVHPIPYLSWAQCCGGRWALLPLAKTWQNWVTAAKTVRAFIVTKYRDTLKKTLVARRKRLLENGVAAA